ncbi:MAG: chemotaxis-specific protein-glutamate methyltransferase CheB [Pseudomonadota bacterium]
MHSNLSSSSPSLSASKKKSVVIVDDSRTLRNWLRVVLEQEPRLEVVGEADCAQAARQVIKATNPDVITLDIEMPGMNGIDFLEKLMTLFPKPVVMISGATRSNSEATITALSLGAVDCILKPGMGADEAECKNIARRVFSAACSTVQRIQKPAPAVTRTASALDQSGTPLIVIGASTGGVGALERVLADLPIDGPPVVIVQHMPGAFLLSFSQLLNRNLPLDVALAREGEPLSPGQIRLAPADGAHTHIRRIGGRWQCYFEPDDGQSLHCPSVDALFHSAEPFSKDIIGVILTGLGKDGAEGLHRLHHGGALTFGQDEGTSVVYGMPRAAFENGAVQVQLPLQDIGAAVNRAVLQHASTSHRRGQ